MADNFTNSWTGRSNGVVAERVTAATSYYRNSRTTGCMVTHAEATSFYYDVRTADISVAEVDSGFVDISEGAMLAVERVVQAGILPPLVLCGVVMNVINMAVFFRHGLRHDRVTLCLFCLALSDTGYLLSLMTFRAYAIAGLVSREWGEWWKASMVFVIGIYHVFADSSDLLTMLIAVERCVCVLLPLHAKTWLSVRNTLVYIVIAVFICMPTNLVFCFKYDVITYLDPVTNNTRYATTVTPFYLAYNWVTKLHEIVNVIVPVTAFVIVIVSTTFTTLRMRRVLSWRQATTNVRGMESGGLTSGHERREAAMTRMLMTICALFTVCLLPYVSIAVIRLAVKDFNPEGNLHNALWASTALMHMLLAFNASVNFVVYVRMGSKFKATLRHMLGCAGAPSTSEASSQQDSDTKNSSVRQQDHLSASSNLSIGVAHKH